MKLVQYKVTDFRSVRNSGWIEVDAVTALIGVNESGKTNLLLPLWKLNPAREGELQATSDYPKTMFGEIRDDPGAYSFVTADFSTEPATAKLAELAGLSLEEAAVVRVRRFYDGEYEITFPEHKRQVTKSVADVRTLLLETAKKLDATIPLKQEEGIAPKLSAGVSRASSDLPTSDDLDADALNDLISYLSTIVPEQPAKTSVIVPMVQQLIDGLRTDLALIEAPQPGEMEGVKDAVLKGLPKFVYYSNYGNLDSEIYLPHVVHNLGRTDLGSKEAAKARTLRVLFQFVKLSPPEILELGQDFKGPDGKEPTQAQIDVIAEKKRIRSILLQSAGAGLTAKFKDWWKQGDYRFRFEADGSLFRIWVADDRRPEEVELENRSTGLQWFLSFYLVFLVESLGEHKEAILLLDEPGLSLHPLAQRNLSEFFENLSSTNQLIYTSHSPFLVDADRLERARKVYVSDDGTTKATADLRHNEGPREQAGAAYAVHSALNLTVAESLLLGCQPVIVEGASDQHYLTAIKAILVAGKRIAPRRELVFPPSGGTKTTRVVASMLTGRDESLPFVLLDADEPGKRMAKELTAGLYAAEPNKVLSVGGFVGFDGAEIEDLFSAHWLAEELDRIERNSDVPFADEVRPGLPFVLQVEAWAKAQQLKLPQHWKVELAKRAKQRALRTGPDSFDATLLEMWQRLFEAFTPQVTK